MITTFVQFKLPQAISPKKAEEIFMSTAHKYREIPGLIRKYYLLSEDGTMAGGVYLWQTREQAEKLYNDEWVNFVREKYGSAPSVTYFETPVIVDNVSEVILQEGR